MRRGAERYLEDLAHYLAGRGHDVTVVTGTRATRQNETRDDGVEVRRLPHVRPGPAWRLGLSEVETFGMRAIGELARLRPQVVHAFTPSGALAARAARRRTLYTVLGHPDREQIPNAAVPRTLFTSAVRRSTVTAALSRASAGAVERELGRDALVLPPGVMLGRFTPRLEARSGPPRLLFSASLNDRRKRADLAVAALSVLLDTHPDARLGLSGEGDPSWALEAASADARVRAAIDVLGPGDPSEVPARYRDATVTILPAEHEAFGLALVESLASGTTAVCTPSGGMPEILQGQDVGAVASRADAVSLAAAAELAIRLSADPATARRCVERAAVWSWDSVVGPAHERLYEHMVKDDVSNWEPGPW